MNRAATTPRGAAFAPSAALPALRARGRASCARRRGVVVATAAAPARTWAADSWRAAPGAGAPAYADQAAADAALARLARALPLVFSGECDTLAAHLARVARGEAHLLQGGEAVETFAEFEGSAGAGVKDTFVLLIQMSILMMYGMRKPVVKILRGGGQYALDDGTGVGGGVPPYMGDILNGAEESAEARELDPQRMVRAYEQATATINLLRTVASGGQLDLHRIHDINLKFVRGTPQGQRFAEEADHIAAALSFIQSVGLTTDNRRIRQADFFTSHECVLLPYEESLVRTIDETGKHYATSAHFLWISDGRRAIDGPYVEFLRGISNPVGVNVSSDMSSDELLALLDKLNPDNTPGRVSIITSFGAGRTAELLPDLVRAAKDAGREVVWTCDPCGGNTVVGEKGARTRRFDDIVREVREFFAAHEGIGSHPGGLHLELTGSDVQECVGGMLDVADKRATVGRDVSTSPRLNANQALELSFLVSETLKNRCVL